MNKEEQIKQEIKQAQETLQRAQEKLEQAQKKLEDLENSKFGWWKPVEREIYFFIDNAGGVWQDNNGDVEVDHMRLEFMNCFKTREEAKLEQLQIIIRRKIQDIVLRLNKGRKIDWSDNEQKKYRLFVYYDPKKKVLSIGSNTCGREDITGFICLSPAFDIVVKEELEDSLKDYFVLKDRIDECS